MYIFFTHLLSSVSISLDCVIGGLLHHSASWSLTTERSKTVEIWTWLRVGRQRFLTGLWRMIPLRLSSWPLRRLMMRMLTGLKWQCQEELLVRYFFVVFCVCNIFHKIAPFITGTSVLSDFHTDNNVLPHSTCQEQLAACQEKLREVSHRLKDANLKLLGKWIHLYAMN